MEDRDDLTHRLRALSTGELLDVLRKHDVTEWQPVVFEIARQLLLERRVDVNAAVAASSREDARTGEPPDLTTIATFATVVGSESCRSALASAGFNVFVMDANAVAVDPALWPALGGVKLAVPSAEAEEAREFLAAVERGELASAPEVAIECPSCGSSNVRFISRTDRQATIASALLVGLVAPVRDGSYKCDDCGADVG